MNKKILIFVILCLFIGAGASSTVFGKEMIEHKRDVYVDGNIRLTRAHLPLLKASIHKCENNKCNSLINRIIEKIEKNKIVDNIDIEEIINELNINSIEIYFLKEYQHMSFDFFIFPGYLISLFFYLSPFAFFIYDGEYKENTDTYLFGFIGLILVVPWHLEPHRHEQCATFDGISLLQITI